MCATRTDTGLGWPCRECLHPECRPLAPAGRLITQYGRLRTLPDDFTGPRHVVTVKQLHKGETAKSGTNGRSGPDWDCPTMPTASAMSRSSG